MNEIDKNPEDVASGGGSLIEQINARRAERLQDETLRLAIPTWDGEVMAKYRVLEIEDVEKLQRTRQMEKDKRKAKKVDSDFISKACVGVFAVTGYDDDGEPILERISRGFDKALAEALGKTGLETSRQVIDHMFNGNDIAISAHALRIGNWMQDTSQNVGDDGPLGG